MLGPWGNPARATVVPFWRKTILHVEGVCSRVTASAGVSHAIAVCKVSDLPRKFGNFGMVLRVEPLGCRRKEGRNMHIFINNL